MRARRLRIKLTGGPSCGRRAAYETSVLSDGLGHAVRTFVSRYFLGWLAGAWLTFLGRSSATVSHGTCVS